MNAAILSIEDSEHLQYVLKMTLEFKGYQVTTAGNGREGLEAARKASFDMIFCDIDMPVMNGIDFVKHYRAEIDKATPIILLTAESGDLITLGLAAGANGIVNKPFEPMQLLNEVEKRLSPK